MMVVDYEPRLVEQAVLVAAQWDAIRCRELHAAIDPLYELPPGEARERAFTLEFARAFRRTGLDRVVGDLLNERPLIAEAVGRCIVRSPARKQESAELLVRPGDGGPSERTLVIQVRPESLARSARQPPGISAGPGNQATDRWHGLDLMRRELLHVADMVDPAFGYQPQDLLGNTPREHLVRDRYRVLWDLYVHGRLADNRPGESAAGFGSALARVFRISHVQTPSVISRVLEAEKLTHQELLEWARRPEQLIAGGGCLAGCQ